MKLTQSPASSPQYCSKHSNFRLWVLGLALFSLFLSSCSEFVIKNTYKRLDWLAVGMVDDYFDINDAQEKELETELKSLLAWHKVNELPRYDKFLEQIKELVNQPQISADDIHGLYDELYRTRRIYIDKAAPVVVNFLASVDDKQLDYLRKELDDYNKEEEEEDEDQTDEERYEKRLESRIERAEDFFGDLTQEQTEILTASVTGSNQQGIMRAEQRRVYQDKFIAFMRSKPKKDLIEATVIDWLKNPQQLQNPASIKSNEARTEENIKLMIEIHATMSPKQKLFMNEEINKYQEYISAMQK